METINLDVECPSCEGTWLFQGMVEKEGCAVVCYNCEGTGLHKHTYSYKVFAGRQPRKDIKRVFKNSYGYTHCPDDYYVKDEGITIRFSKGGCTYEEWLAGAEPKYMEQLYCPYLADRDFKCRAKDSWIGHIPDCKFYKDKAVCWEEYNKQDKE